MEKLSGHEKAVLDTLKMGVDRPDSPMMACLGRRPRVGMRGEDIDVAGEKRYNMPMNIGDVGE